MDEGSIPSRSICLYGVMATYYPVTVVPWVRLPMEAYEKNNKKTEIN